MTRGGIHSVALTFSLVLEPTNIVANDEFPWPDSPCGPPTLAQRVRGVTETFPYETETLAGLHGLPCVFQTGPAFLGERAKLDNQTGHLNQKRGSCLGRFLQTK